MSIHTGSGLGAQSTLISNPLFRIVASVLNLTKRLFPVESKVLLTGISVSQYFLPPISGASILSPSCISSQSNGHGFSLMYVPPSSSKDRTVKRISLNTSNSINHLQSNSRSYLNPAFFVSFPGDLITCPADLMIPPHTQSVSSMQPACRL
jgi:hypothetical protein